MNGPIIVGLRGRLGNQLFQFATGYALSLRLRCDLAFDTHRVAPEDLLLPDVIGERYRLAGDRDLLRVGHRDARLPRRPARYLRSWAAQRHSHVMQHSLVVTEKRPDRFNPRVLEAKPPVFLQGFFQTERYFEDVADQIDDAIAVPSPESLRPQDLPRPVVGVCFRRGDYLDYGWALPIRYQEAALERLCARVQPGTVLVFCDDPEFGDLVLPRLERFGPARNAQPRVPDPIATLGVLAACDHLVVTNSSFAWWGAWLGDRRSADPRRMVLAPPGWIHGRPDLDTVPSRWELVEWS